MKLAIFVKNYITMPFINRIELGLQDTGAMLNWGVIRKVVHSTMHPPNIRYRNGLYLEYRCFLLLDKEYQNPDDEAPKQNTVHTEQ